jgi:hypothetical protein
LLVVVGLTFGLRNLLRLSPVELIILGVTEKRGLWLMLLSWAFVHLGALDHLVLGFTLIYTARVVLAISIFERVNGAIVFLL